MSYRHNPNIIGVCNVKNRERKLAEADFSDTG